MVLHGAGNQHQLAVLSRLIGAPAELTTWAQRDGVPVFQVARFGGGWACGKPEPGDGLAGSAAPAVALDPPAFPACEFLAPASVVRVRWHAGSDVQAVAITVTEPGTTARGWSVGATRGVAQTGPWAVPGMAFTLRDAASGRALASAVLGSAPCPEI